MIYLSNIKAKDIFYAEHFDFYGRKTNHYFYCVYSQANDKSHLLYRDIIGLIITTRKPKGYYESVIINGKVAYVCCDNEHRFSLSAKNVETKDISLTKEEHKKIIKKYENFMKIKIKQLKKGEKK